MIRLTIPVPPSANDYYRYAGRAVFRTALARAYIKDIRTRLALAGVKRIGGTVEVAFLWYRDRRVGDLDNRLKILVDALKQIAFGDDALVRRIICEMSDDQPKSPRLELRITPYTAWEPDWLDATIAQRQGKV